MKAILDACCGSRMFWFDAKDPRALFVDCRKMKTEAIWKSGNGRATRYCTVDPDLVADFRALPFPNESFWHVVFDPPHLLHVGDNAWMAKKYGKLPGDWRPLILDMSRPGGHDSGHIRPASRPIQALTTCDNVQGVFPVLEDGRVIDIRIRMLKPSELAAAHSFPKDYVLTGNRGDQVKQIGNSVPVMTAKAMCEVDFKEAS